MNIALLYSLVSVISVSLISLIGLFLVSPNTIKGKKVLAFLISFSAGALLGDVFIHLLPELAEENQFNFNTSIYILIAILAFFVLEKYLHWHHHHGDGEEHEHAAHPYVYNVLFGDFIHNLIDGLIIAGAYQLDITLGVATTIAVIMHEIPQEVGDFGVLVYGGFTKTKALIYNFISATGAIAGTLIAFAFTGAENLMPFLIALGAGSFIYIATADLIPQIHKENHKPYSQLFGFIFGIGIMAALLLLE